MKLITNKYKPVKPEPPAWPKKVKCDMCKSVLEILKDDTEQTISETDGGASYWINCPACSKYTTYTELKR